MRLLSKSLVSNINSKIENSKISKIELYRMERIVDNFPLAHYVSYRLFNEDNGKTAFSEENNVCATFFKNPKKKAEEVITEIWAYYTARGFKVNILPVKIENINYNRNLESDLDLDF